MANLASVWGTPELVLFMIGVCVVGHCRVISLIMREKGIDRIKLYSTGSSQLQISMTTVHAMAGYCEC